MDIIFLICVLLLLILYCTYNRNNKKENFTNSEIHKMSTEIVKHKDLFVPGVKYGKIKNNINKMDPVMYNDIYQLSLNNSLNFDNVKSTIRKSII